MDLQNAEYRLSQRQVVIPQDGGNDPDGLNRDRTAWAYEALERFKEATETDDADKISDLLADLMHYCAQSNGVFDFKSELETAARSFAVETTDGRL